MEHIRNKLGDIIQTSRNLAGIRRYVPKHLVKIVQLDQLEKGEALLHILFDDGSSFQCRFASFVVLCWTVQNWRSLYGSPFVCYRLGGINETGTIGYRMWQPIGG